MEAGTVGSEKSADTEKIESGHEKESSARGRAGHVAVPKPVAMTNLMGSRTGFGLEQSMPADAVLAKEGAEEVRTSLIIYPGLG